MRPQLFILLLVGGSSFAKADDKQTSLTPSHPNLRDIILANYRFVPRPKPHLPAAPVWSTHKTMADMPPPENEDPRVVKMAPVIVHGDRAVQALDSAVQAQAEQARIQRSNSRLGIREVNLGKTPLHVITVFDIPVWIGVGEDGPPKDEGWGPIGFRASHH